MYELISIFTQSIYGVDTAMAQYATSVQMLGEGTESMKNQIQHKKLRFFRIGLLGKVFSALKKTSNDRTSAASWAAIGMLTDRGSIPVEKTFLFITSTAHVTLG